MRTNLKRRFPRVALLLSILCLAFWSVSSSGTSHADDFLTAQQTTRLGLEEAWRRQLEVPAGVQSIVDQQFYVHIKQAREFVEIIKGKPPEKTEDDPNPSVDPSRVLVRIPTDRVDTNGKEIGKAEAERLARNEVRRLTRRGIEASITTMSIPRIHLYTLGDDGTLECRDAETGELIWLVREGNPILPYKAIGVSEEFVTIVNGGNLLKLDVTNGELIEESRTMNVPIFGALHSGDYAIIPTIRNGIEGYPLNDPDRVPFQEMVAGRALALPVKAPGSTRVAWGTDGGFVYCMESSGEPSVLFRLNTDGIVSGRIASASGNRFFFGSEAGQVYGVEATRSGKVLWSMPYGDPFYHQPVVAGELLLIRSTYGNMYALHLETGYALWDFPAPSIDKIIGTIGDQVFVTTLSGSIAVIDLKTGQRIQTIPGIIPERVLHNPMTDRLYLVGSTGYIQCLRTQGADLPTISEGYDQLSEPPEEEEAEAGGPKKPATAAPDFNTPAGDDPFGAPGADPFGAPGSDPFGAPGGDPFGGGAAGGDDPFGSDPFGG